jgi:hypothetical protein
MMGKDGGFVLCFFLIWFNCFFNKEVEGRDRREGWFG